MGHWKIHDKNPMTPILLTDISPKDKKWDESHKRQDSFADILQETNLKDNYKERALSCANFIGFVRVADQFKLRDGNFCHVPLCPLCQQRRLLVNTAKMMDAAKKVRQEKPKYEFLLLTLTVDNCPVQELRETLNLMSRSWSKMTQRKQWPAKGFMRRLEISRERKRPEYCHPHYHCVLLVPSSYRTGYKYLSQEAWTQLWKSCLKANYKPIIDVRLVSVPKGTKSIGTNAENAEMRALWKIIRYVTKYVNKEADLLWELTPEQIVATKDNIRWFEELFTQLHNVKFISAGGMFKKYINLKEQEMTDEELIHSGMEVFDFESESESDDSLAEDLDKWWFVWDRYFKRYLLHVINQKTA